MFCAVALVDALLRRCCVVDRDVGYVAIGCHIVVQLSLYDGATLHH